MYCSQLQMPNTAIFSSAKLNNNAQHATAPTAVLQQLRMVLSATVTQTHV